MSITLSSSDLKRLTKVAGQGPQPSPAGSGSPLFWLLFSSEGGRLARFFRRRDCQAGEVVFHENERGDTAYLIWSGRVIVVKGDFQSPDSNAATVLGYRSAGEIVGEMSLLENRPRSASVVAVTPLRLLALSRESFEQLLKENPSVSLSVMAALSARLRESDQALTHTTIQEKSLSGEVTRLKTEKQRLEELQRLRQEMVDLIVHDLRNPLGAISTVFGIFSMVLPEEIKIENKELLDLATSACERMLRMVNSLLDVSQMEAGQAQLLRSEVDLGELLEDVIERSAKIDKKGLNLKAQIDEGLPKVTVDRDRIERVIVNLVENAMKYTPEGGQVTARAALEDSTLAVRIVDTGPGIAVDDREYIFERFAQGQGERALRRGFGLGLSYCRLAVEAHGGRIWYEPGENETGSQFVFTLPVEEAQTAD